MCSGFDRMYTFIYHKDLEKADRFYGELLGLEMEPESDWVIYYRVQPNVTIGVVQDGRGYLRATEDKPVILCLGVPDDGDIWEVYDRLKEAGVRMHTSEVELREAEGRVFFCEDPEGYVVEIVQRPKDPE
jgi:lactoylglutathione lyase